MVGVALLLGACSKSSSGKTAASTTGSSSASTPASSSSPSAQLPPGCDAAPPPSNAVHVSRATADVDGDGQPDTVVVYGTGTVDQPAPYHVQVQFAAGKGIVDTVIEDAGNDGTQLVKALGAAEISARAGLPPDGTGAEVFVTVGSGASSSVVGIYQYGSCVLLRLLAEGSGAPATFPVGGTVTHYGTLRCDGTAGGQRLVVMSAQSDDGVTYQTSEQPLQVQEGHLVADGPPVTGTSDASAPSLERFTHLDCPGVMQP